MSAVPVEPAPDAPLLPFVTSGVVELSPQRCRRCLLPLPVLDVAEGHTTHGACVAPPADITTARRRKRR